MIYYFLSKTNGQMYIKIQRYHILKNMKEYLLIKFIYFNRHSSRLGHPAPFAFVILVSRSIHTSNLSAA